MYSYRKADIDGMGPFFYSCLPALNFSHKGAEWNKNFTFGFELEALKILNQRRL